MDERIGLVFSWDPRAKAWLKERGPEDAAPPPAQPIDLGAVQTYFLDPASGRWEGTILGLRARQVAAQLQSAYRMPVVAGLAIEPPRRPKVQKYDQDRRSPLPAVLGVLALLALVGGGAFAANAMLAPATQPAPTVAASVPQTAAAPTAAAPATNTTGDGTAASAPAATAPTAARTAAPASTVAPTAPVRTAAPPPQSIATVTHTARLSNGTTITFTGPNGVIQNTAFDATFRATAPNGQPAYDNLTITLGPLGTGQAVTITPNASGVYFASIKVSLPKGDQLLSARFGAQGETRALGTISVR